MNLAKKTLWICIGLLLFASISVVALLPEIKEIGAEFVSGKHYNEGTETITIVDGVIFGDKLVEHKLTYNTYQCLSSCYATGETILYQDAPLFTNLNFIDQEERDTQIISSTTLLQKIEDYPVEVDDYEYEEVCNDLYDSFNETWHEECYINKIKIGSHTETRTKVW